MEAFTKTPNWTIDLMRELNGNEYKILMFVVRKTAGWHKEVDTISLSQFTDGTGLALRSVQKGLAVLIDRGTIQRGPMTRDGYTYSLAGGIISEGVAESSTLGVAESSNTKEILKESRRSPKTLSARLSKAARVKRAMATRQRVWWTLDMPELELELRKYRNFQRAKPCHYFDECVRFLEVVTRVRDNEP